MNEAKLVEAINLCYRAVDKSIVGPMFMDKEKGVMNTLAMNAFYNVLNNVLPKEMTSNLKLQEPKEPWQEGE